MKTLKIEVPNGYEIDKEQSTFENIVFKEIEKELPKSWEELGEIEGYFVSECSKISDYFLTHTKNGINRNIFATEEQAEASIALAQLSQLREVYRQGWKPDWENGNDAKWCIIVHENKLTIREYIVSNTFLSFQTRGIASQFLDNFSELIEKAKPLMS
jgi:hypothetical protein